MIESTKMETVQWGLYAKNPKAPLELWRRLLTVKEDLGVGVPAELSIPRECFGKEWGGTKFSIVLKVLQPLIEMGIVFLRLEGRRRTGITVRTDQFAEDVIKTAARNAERRKPAEKDDVIDPEPSLASIPINVKQPHQVVPLSPRIPRRNPVPQTIRVYIDLPNMTDCGDVRHNDASVLALRRMNWAVVRNKLAVYQGERYPIVSAKIYIPEERHVIFEEFLRSARMNGFEIVMTPGAKDVDPYLAAGIMEDVIQSLYVSRDDRLPIVTLVSGDCDYIPSIETVRTFAQKEGLSISLRVISWNSKCLKQFAASSLRRMAGEFVYIEDHLMEIDPVGARRLHRIAEKFKKSS